MRTIGPSAVGVALSAIGLVLWPTLGCRTSGPDLSPVRFRSLPIVTRVEPAYPVDEAPEERPDRPHFYFLDRMFAHGDRQLALPDEHPAADVNALGEVPSSSWWVARHPTPAEVEVGPPGGHSPVLPLTVEKTKGEGYAVGLFVRDGEGRRFLLKLDAAHTPEVETSGHVVTQRLLWALGYHVPFDEVMDLTRDDLVLAEGAEIKRGLLSDPLRRSTLGELLDTGPSRIVDGQPVFRFLVSEFVQGRPLGGAPQVGVRSDDPNDLIPHERRRSLRGLGLMAAWLDHWDMKDANTLDVLFEGPGKPHVRHLLIDFGKALGGFGRVDRIPKNGFGYLVEGDAFLVGLFSFGLYARPWERRALSDLRGVGWYTAEPFDPDEWRAFAPYAPFRARDPNDDLWAALRIARLSPAHVAAAVAAGRYSEQASARQVLEVLLARRQTVLAHAFARRAPLDGFRVDGDRLCWTDWSERSESGSTLILQAQLHDVDSTGEAAEAQVAAVEGDCMKLDVPPAEANYRIARILASGGRVTEVHVGCSSACRVVGVVRGREGQMDHAHP